MTNLSEKERSKNNVEKGTPGTKGYVNCTKEITLVLKNLRCDRIILTVIKKVPDEKKTC